MIESIPIVFVPGLNSSARVYADQIPHLWRHGPVLIADHTHGDSMADMAKGILAVAPPRFALIGFSMGGYIAFEMLRQARDRVMRLALLDTSARPDTPEQMARRRERIALAQSGKFDETIEKQFLLAVHNSRHHDDSLRQRCRTMAHELGVDVFVRHLTAIMGRPDSRPDLGAIRCPALVLVGDSDGVTPPEYAKEMAAGIAGSRLVVVPECGHYSPIERPEAVTAALVEWIKG